MKTLESGEKVPRLWLTYSLVKHAMVCLPCFLFASETSGVSGKYRYSKEWSEDGVSNWKKGLEKLCDREKSESHQICSEKLENLQCGVPIDEVIDRQRALATQKSHEKILRNKAIMSRVIGLVELFARQNILVKIGLTLPVTSCTSERTFSELRLLKSYLRSTMVEERISRLATIFCNNDLHVNIKMSFQSLFRLVVED